MDVVTVIGQEVKSIMGLIADMDDYQPDEDLVEVLVGSVSTWGAIEAQLLFPALEAELAEAEQVVAGAQKRLNTLHELQDMMHEDIYSDDPWSATARKYVDAVKYHLLVDVQDIVPLANQLSSGSDRQLAASMRAMKLELE